MLTYRLSKKIKFSAFYIQLCNTNQVAVTIKCDCNCLSRVFLISKRLEVQECNYSKNNNITQIVTATTHGNMLNISMVH